MGGARSEASAPTPTEGTAVTLACTCGRCRRDPDGGSRGWPGSPGAAAPVRAGAVWRARGRRGELGPAPLRARRRRRLSAQARPARERAALRAVHNTCVWGRRGAERRWGRAGTAAASAASAGARRPRAAPGGTGNRGAAAPTPRQTWLGTSAGAPVAHGGGTARSIPRRQRPRRAAPPGSGRTRLSPSRLVPRCPAGTRAGGGRTGISPASGAPPGREGRGGRDLRALRSSSAWAGKREMESIPLRPLAAAKRAEPPPQGHRGRCCSHPPCRAGEQKWLPAHPGCPQGSGSRCPSSPEPGQGAGTGGARLGERRGIRKEHLGDRWQRQAVCASVPPSQGTLSVGKDWKHGSLNRRVKVCKSEEGGGRLHLCQQSAFVVYIRRQYGVTEQ